MVDRLPRLLAAGGRCRLALRDAHLPGARLDLHANLEVLRQRLRERAASGLDPSDADETRLAAQMRTAEPLQADHRAAAFRCPPSAPSAKGAIQADWTPLLEWMAASRFVSSACGPDH